MLFQGIIQQEDHLWLAIQELFQIWAVTEQRKKSMWHSSCQAKNHQIWQLPGICEVRIFPSLG